MRRPRSTRKLANGLHRAHRVVQEGQPLGQLRPLAADHRGAGDHVGMAIQVFGGGMHHDVEAEGQRALHHRRGEGVVRHRDQAVPSPQIGHRSQVTSWFSGLDGVSTQIMRVFGRISACKAARSSDAT